MGQRWRRVEPAVTTSSIASVARGGGAADGVSCSKFPPGVTAQLPYRAGDVIGSLSAAGAT